MKKRFLPIATAISAAALLAACSQTDLIDDGSVKGNGTADNNAVTFSTYTAKKGGTRADEPKVDETATGELQSTGFGVFAYYTPGDIYGKVRNLTAKPNFMYNQEIEYNGNWTYTPLKYWPNDFQQGNVDDKAAQGSGNNGNVSFFAYAPYTELATGTLDHTKDVATINTNEGIVKMIGNDMASDPIITYNIAGKKDLLWGTLKANYTDAGGTQKKGVTGIEKPSSEPTPEPDRETQYKYDILTGETVAADLTKQKVGDQIQFLFKHALAGIAGTTETTTDETKTESGFKVMLDIDNSVAGEVPENPAITGGDREKFKISNGKAVPLTGGEDEADTYYRTIVTIEEVSITNDLDGDGEIKSNETNEKDERLLSSGKLNLATGVWSRTANGADDLGTEKFDQTIKNGPSNSIAMNSDIAELDENGNSYFTTSTSSDEILKHFKVKDNDVEGVVEKIAKNVYADGKVSPILLIPGQTPKFRVNVVYVVRQYDDALAQQYTKVVNKISKIVTFPEMLQNTHYTIVMHLGLTSVKFTAEVAEWGEYNPDGSADGTGGTSGNKPVIVELPSNVVD